MAKKKSVKDKHSSSKKAGKSAKSSAKSSAKAVATAQDGLIGDAKSSAGAAAPELADALRVPRGPVDLAAFSTMPLDIGPQNKEHALSALEKLGPGLADLQEKLYAQSVAGNRRSVLVVLQGMDTAGKDGVINHAMGLLDPGGVRLTSFKTPTAEELAHDFLWRVRKAVPRAGEIGIFNRSHYEDVLIVRVHDLVPKAVWSKRYALINAFERELAKSGVTVLKCFLHVSKEQQAERLLARLDDPTKYWKFNPADVDERLLWDDYQTAYTDVLAKCSTVGAPWHVIPSDKKWYRNWAVASLLFSTLAGLDPQYPPAGYDIDEQRRRVQES
ncbi:polyphosphate kinase 2 family protein [Nakamurella lactea]|uniref:polyphosphate kinase 2 family protein n=1 Tax=Nakamurella lactea TaxID=459515 RepID=UPI000400D072|nr:polyphosphate kinase 2 family protein [Nakamurella lactea]